MHTSTCGCSGQAKECGASENLYAKIDTSKITCLNEREKGSGKNPIKAWDDRLESKSELWSNDDDSDLLLYIPFVAQVKVKAFSMIGGTNDTTPTNVKIWVNRDDIDFSNVDDVKPTQTVDLCDDDTGEIFYPTQITKYQNVSSLTILFTNENNEDESCLRFLSFRGEDLKHKREAVNVVYEAQANPADHKKISGMHNVSSSIGH